MLAVFKREVKSYFLTPIGYIFIGVFILLEGYFFLAINLSYQTAELTDTLANVQVILLFITPILTMKLLAEERKNGTEQLLVTSPVSLTGIVTGKYLAALFVFFVSIVLSLIYPVILAVYGNPSITKMIGEYAALFLLGAAFISIGLFTSSLTDNQIVSAVTSFGIMLLLWLIQWLTPLISNTAVIEAINWLSILRKNENMLLGIVEAGPIVYYLSFISLFVFLTIRVIEKRRWSEG